MMPRNPQAQVSEGNFTRNMFAEKGHDLKEAATEWAGTMKEKVRSNVVKAGYQTETYVRSHPGRFIAGAACVGVAAGFFLARSSKKK
jgi:ElaB/YqjD/DUF883 family membrane-anchored ribosome-binding protein